MKVHLVSEHASPLAVLGCTDAGGQNVHVAALARALARLGAEVVVHTRRDDPSLPRRIPFGRGVVVDLVDAGPPEPVPRDDLLPLMEQFAVDLERQWSRDTPDVVHAHFWMSGLASVAAASSLDLPVALTYHALGVEKRRHLGDADPSPACRIDTETTLGRSVDRVIATTHAECAELRALGVEESQITVVPCGVDVDGFSPLGPTWPTRGQPFRIVCVSRLVERKGIADVIRAVAGLDGVELLVAGGPAPQLLATDAYATDLMRLAERCGASGSVRFLGAVDHDHVASLMRSADVVCATPWYEPFGLVAVEAMACGVPVVATQVGGLAETVIDGVTGRLVPARSPDQLRSALRELMDDDALRDRMRAAARWRARAYGWTAIARRTLGVYGELLAAHAAADVVPDGSGAGVAGGAVS